MLTGDETVAPLAGEQMVTDGLTVLSVHGAAMAGKAMAKSANKIDNRRSVLIAGPQSVVEVEKDECRGCANGTRNLEIAVE